MLLPYHLGCPSWNDSAWRDALLGGDTGAGDQLDAYCRLFSAVEGNTTFYARPSIDTVQRWAARMPAHFRFCAKFHRDISHAADLRPRIDTALELQQLLSPLGERIAPWWLQLPASFGPARLAELAAFTDAVPGPLAVEVRHRAFFDKGEGERALNRLLQGRGIERICLDTRALFSCHSDDPAVLHAQSRKPRLPTRPAAFGRMPQLRFIGHPELPANDPFLAPWVDKVAGWIEAGLVPYVFLHTPDNALAPQLARRFHDQLRQRLPGLPALPEGPRPAVPPQLQLL